MVNRMMDLVVLVAEISQHSRKSLKELDKELVTHGYSSEEIQQALFWITSQWRPIDPDACGAAKPTIRVLAPWEVMGLASDAHGYLLRLQHLGLLDDIQLERIMKRVVPYAGDKLRLPEVKALAGRVIFDTDSEDIEETLFQVLDDEMFVI